MSSATRSADLSVIEGSLVAIATPMRGPDAALDLDALRELIDRLIEGGVDGIVPCGTTGESATMTLEEREQVIRTTVEQVAGRVPVVAGTGTNDTRVTIELSQRARELGADALLVVAPYYNKPTQEGLYRHFTAVADAVALPQIVYNVPGRSVVTIEVATLARLSHHPHIVATKDATGDMRIAAETLEACGDRLGVLSGDDVTTFPLLALGGHGTISVVGNIAPRLVSDLCLASREARWTDARQLHYQILPLFRALFAVANPIPVKAALALQGIGENQVRLPLVPLEGDALARLRDTLQRAGLLDGRAS